MARFFYLISYYRVCCCLASLAICLLPFQAKATHIRAGEILYRHLSENTYEIILRGYADRGSSVLFGSNGVLDFGDGNFIDLQNDGEGGRIPRWELADDTWFYEFKVTHTYTAPGNYLISFRELYRNEGILNMDNSVNVPFYAESVVFINPAVGPNDSPILRRPPVDKTMVGATYHHQPGATDADGDSLAYRLVPNRQSKYQQVPNYRHPNLTFPIDDPRNGSNESGGSPYFIINPYTGDVIWDAPGTAGDYNYALVVEEWRRVNGQLYNIGSVMRDMQIVVEPKTENFRLQFPFSSTSVAPAAEEPQQWIIAATAQNPEDSIVLEIWGDFMERTDVNLSSRQQKAIGEASITINWKGEVDLKQNYQLIARAYNPQEPAEIRARSVFINPSQNPLLPLGKEENVVFSLEVYPNPMTGNLCYVDLPEALGREVEVALYNTNGSLLQREKTVVTARHHPVRISTLKPGLYILHITYSGTLQRAKLLVQ